MDEELSQVLQHLLTDAGAAALARFRSVAANQKADGSVVTEADHAAEEVIVEGLMRHFPGEGIRGEEGAAVTAREGHATWYVDPIDGTSSYLAQLGYWGPTVCRVTDGALDVGAFYVPRMSEYWFAQKGGGAWRDGVRLEPSDDLPPSQQVLYVPSRFHRRGPTPWHGKVRALGSGAAHLALTAAGSGVGAVIAKWELWDVGCGALLIHETGRMIWDLSGNVLAPEASEPGVPMLAGTPQVYEALITGGWAEQAMRRSSASASGG